MAREPTKTTRGRKPAAAKGTTTGRTPAKKPATANKPKTTKAPAKPRSTPRSNTRKAVDTAANLKTAENAAPKKAKPLPLPDAPAHDAELLELDARNMVGDYGEDGQVRQVDENGNAKWAFLDSATPLITAPTFGIKGVLMVAVLGLLVGLLFGGAWGYSNGLDKGWGQGQRSAYLTTSIAAMQNYLQCTEDPPACEGQQATATWVKTYADGKLAELEDEAD